jgi:hypothetical protein
VQIVPDVDGVADHLRLCHKGSSNDIEPGSGAPDHRFRSGSTAGSWQRSSRMSGRSLGTCLWWPSAAALDAEFVALEVGHHDPTTRRGLASVINDPRTE